MIHWRNARVSALLDSWPGVRVAEAVLDTPLPGTDTVRVKALAYTDTVGSPEVGTRVLLNVSALARGLGTGGYALVVALPDDLPADPPVGPGHLVKDRYSPAQTMVLGVDDQESEHHAALAGASELHGLPVVVADLHSALPAVLAGIRSRNPQARVAYVMTDGGALPIAFSKAVAGLKEAGWLSSTVTVGQAYGGDLEAATVHSGLLAAREVSRADIVVVAQGPGNLGTGTAFGFSGMAVADHLHAVEVLGGRPIAVARVSNADARERHLGISHHTLTAVGRCAPRGTELVVPRLWDLPDAEAARCEPDPRGIAELVKDQVRALTSPEIVLAPVEGLLEVLETSPVRLSTMGRGLTADASSFLAAAAAGAHAAGFVAGD